ncbi:hypothetical protein ACQ0QQ_00060 [Lysinibacillus sphaericus]
MVEKDRSTCTFGLGAIEEEGLTAYFVEFLTGQVYWKRKSQVIKEFLKTLNNRS